MPKYIVKTVIDNGRGYPIHLQRTITARSAEQAVSAAHREWGETDGYPGPFRGTSAEGVDDPHDYFRSTL